MREQKEAGKSLKSQGDGVKSRILRESVGEKMNE